MSLSFNIYFKNPIFKDIDMLHFIENKNIIYYNNSHMNYIYSYSIDNIEYTFHGFYKDDFLVIICDSYNKDLLVNVELKYVMLLKLKWIEKQIKEQLIYVVDTDNIKNYKTNCYVLNVRKRISTLLMSNTVEDCLKLCEYNIINSIINYKNKNYSTNKYNLIEKIKNIIT